MRADAPRAIVFDAAGTLLRLRESVGTVYSRFATKFGVTVLPTQLDDGFRRIFAQTPTPVFPGRPQGEIAALEKAWWREVVRRTFRAADSTILESHFCEGFEKFFNALWNFYSSTDAWQAAPDTGWLLDALHGVGLRTAVLSNFDHRLPKLLEQTQLLQKFEAVILPSEAGATKPSPVIFEFALQRLALTNSQVIYVGDHPTQDLAAARACGWRAIDVRGHTSLRTLYAEIAAAL